MYCMLRDIERRRKNLPLFGRFQGILDIFRSLCVPCSQYEKNKHTFLNLLFRIGRTCPAYVSVMLNNCLMRKACIDHQKHTAKIVYNSYGVGSWILFSSTNRQNMNTKVGLHHHHPPPQTFRPLPEGLGRWNSGCNLIYP